jgi:TATA-binding protein-associated factor
MHFVLTEKEYGFDFVDFGIGTNVSSIDISAELDLLTLEIDMDEELEESPFGEDNDFEDDSFDDEEVDETEQEKDEYEFDDYDEDIFRDPLQMLKLLEANDKRKNETDLPPILKDSVSQTTLGTDLASFFREFDLEVIDKRSKGGCLWVIGDEQDLEEYIEFAEKEYGVTGGFASGKATGGRVGWYTRSNK